MSMTTTIEWTIYDGTPKTFPEHACIIVVNTYGTRKVLWGYKSGYENDDGSFAAIYKGDMWAPWPELQEK